MMSAEVEYLSNKASTAQVTAHLLHCDADFVPTLSGRVNINDYAQKITSKAIRFEAWSGGTLVGLVAAYCNNLEDRIAYITSVSVLKAWTGKGIAAHLLSLCVEHAKVSGMQEISLEVASNNVPAISMYKKIGFIVGEDNAPLATMHLRLKGGK